MKTITTVVYDYDELDEAAKEEARNWYRETALYNGWWGGVYEDAKAVGELLGMDIKDIGFSGFSSQGDGAHFVGSWSHTQDNTTAIASRNDLELERIANGLRALPSNMSASVKHRGHYQHSGCTSIECSFDCDPIENMEVDSQEWNKRNAVLVAAFDECVTLLRSYMDWIYKQLETEHDYQLADDTVADNIRANEYTFTAIGRREG